MNKHFSQSKQHMHGSKAIGIADRLSAAIQNSLYVPGQRLVEAELTASLGISRGLLREAFRSLSAEGVIEIIPNRGAIVRRLSRREVSELFEIRMELEALAARLAAARMAQKPVADAFAAATISIRDRRLRGSPSEYLSENQQFHMAIFSAAGSRELQNLNRRLHLSLLMSQISSRLDADTILSSISEHRLIADAILAGDVNGADGASRAHLARARDFMQTLPDDLFGRDA